MEEMQAGADVSLVYLSGRFTVADVPCVGLVFDDLDDPLVLQLVKVRLRIHLTVFKSEHNKY